MFLMIEKYVYVPIVDDDARWLAGLHRARAAEIVFPSGARLLAPELKQFIVLEPGPDGRGKARLVQRP
jgi:hypothetical protein